jgi:hypothetical protein
MGESRMHLSVSRLDVLLDPKPLFSDGFHGVQARKARKTCGEGLALSSGKERQNTHKTNRLPP